MVAQVDEGIFPPLSTSVIINPPSYKRQLFSDFDTTLLSSTQIADSDVHPPQDQPQLHPVVHQDNLNCFAIPLPGYTDSAIGTSTATYSSQDGGLQTLAQNIHIGTRNIYTYTSTSTATFIACNSEGFTQANTSKGTTNQSSEQVKSLPIHLQSTTNTISSLENHSNKPTGQFLPENKNPWDVVKLSKPDRQGLKIQKFPERKKAKVTKLPRVATLSTMNMNAIVKEKPPTNKVPFRFGVASKAPAPSGVNVPSGLNRWLSRLQIPKPNKYVLLISSIIFLSRSTGSRLTPSFLAVLGSNSSIFHAYLV